MQSFFDTLYQHPYNHSCQPTDRLLPSDGLYHDLAFWKKILPPNASTWDGKFQFATDTVYTLPNYAHEICTTDASATFGWGARWRAESTARQWEPGELTTEHSTHIELRGILGALLEWGHNWRNKRVLIMTDNLGAMTGVNRGATRSHVNRALILEIACTAISRRFELRAKYIPGPANSADALSRGKERPSSSNWTFLKFGEFNQPPATIDVCAEEDRSNVQPGCAT